MADAPSLIQAGTRWPTDISLWHLRVPREDAPLHALRGELSGDERARADRYRSAAERARYIATRATLRRLLGERVGTLPGALQFTAGAHGRPVLDGHPALSFNVSHAGEHALIAISDTRTVGIDIERIDPALAWRELAGLVCTDEEQHAIACRPPPRRSEAFFRCWSAKEAVLKALGVGIAGGLRAVAADPLSEGMQRPMVSPASRFAAAAALCFHWLEDFSGYVGCIAYSDRRAFVERDSLFGQFGP
jgi:4'-phosphopantetheinyl transferase